MEIDWLAPFKFALEAALWGLGALVAAFVILFIALLFYGMLRAFANAFRTASGKAKEPKKPTLKAVD